MWDSQALCETVDWVKRRLAKSQEKGVSSGQCRARRILEGQI